MSLVIALAVMVVAPPARARARRTRGKVFASIARRGTWFAVVVGLALFLVSQIRIPDLDELLSGALDPVVEMETRRR